MLPQHEKHALRIAIELQRKTRNSRNLRPAASTRRLWDSTRKGKISETGRQIHEFCLTRQVPHADNQTTTLTESINKKKDSKRGGNRAYRCFQEGNNPNGWNKKSGARKDSG
jgi:hypothetical protein